MSPVIKRTQFPLMLAWACTVHKVQGLSLEKAVISFDLLKQKSFQMYVAMSKSYFTKRLNKSSVIKSDPQAGLKYDRLNTNCLAELPRGFKLISNPSLTICLLNTRSLKKHPVDILKHPFLNDNDILCLTETQLMPNQKADDIEKQLENFNIIRNDQTQINFKLSVIINLSI